MKRTLLACVAVLALTACSGTAEPSPSATPSPTASAIATPTPEPSDSPTPMPSPVGPEVECGDETASAIAPGGFAGICLGTSFDDASTMGITPVEPCPWYGQIIADDSTGFYVSAISDPEAPGESIWLFVMSWLGETGQAGEYGLPATPEGISIGSTATEVLDAYPGASEVTWDDISRGPRTQIVAKNAPDLSYNFDLLDGVVYEISWGNGITEGGPRGELCAL